MGRVIDVIDIGQLHKGCSGSHIGIPEMQRRVLPMVVGNGVLGGVSSGYDKFWEFEIWSSETSSIAQVNISNVFSFKLFLERRHLAKELGDQIRVMVGRSCSD